MCVVIDINALHLVFTNKPTEYSSIKEWITVGKGRLVFGGTTYNNELKKANKYLIFFNQLKIARRTVEADINKVDNLEKKLKEIKSERNFDDPHIIAILIVSNCKLLCTKDKKSLKYIKDKNLYPLDYELPIVYSSENKIDLSSKEYLSCHK